MRNKFLWILLAVVLKSAFAFYKVQELKGSNRSYTCSFAIEGGDTQSYIEPIENFFASGKYFDDYRLPGYGFVYLILRMFADVCSALNWLLILQVLVSGISVYLFAEIAARFINHKYAFHVAYIIYLISTFVSLWDVFLLTESFCVAAIIISFFFLTSPAFTGRNLLMSGVFLAWAVFLKPVVFPVLLIVAAALLIRQHKAHHQLIRPVLIFLIAFIVIDGCWIIRNYITHNRFFLLTKATYQENIETTHYGDMIKFVASFGGSVVHWDPGSEISFFKKHVGEMKVKKEALLPEYIFTSQFTMDSLVSLNKLIQLWNDSLSVHYKSKQTDKIISAKFQNYTASIRAEKPFLFHIQSRLILVKRFFLHSGTYNLFNKPASELNKAEYLIKLFYSAFYLIVVVVGFVGMLLLLFQNIKQYNFLFALISLTGLYFAFIYPFVLRLTESRYFLPGYPFFVLALCYFIFQCAHFITQFRKEKI